MGFKDYLEEKKKKQQKASNEDKLATSSNSGFKKYLETVNNPKSNTSVGTSPLTEDDVFSWSNSAKDISTRTKKYLTQEGYKKADTKLADELDKSLVDAVSVRQYLKANKSKYSNYAEVYRSYENNVNALKTLRDNLKDSNEYFSQFNNEKEYEDNKIGWLNPDAEINEETATARQERFKSNEERKEELNKKLPWYASTIMPNWMENWFMSKEDEILRDEYETLKAENNQYKRTQGTLDEYYTPPTEQFKKNAAFRNYTNASKEELWKYDMSVNEGSVALSNGGYIDDEDNIRDSKGNIVQYANAPEVQDKLGMFLDAVKDGSAMDYVGELSAANGNITNTWANLMQEGDVNGWKYLEPNEIDIYYDLYKREGQKAAYKFLEDMTTELTRRETQEREDYINEASVLEQIALNVASIPMSVFGGVSGIVDNAVNLIQGKDINPYSRAHAASNAASDIREDTAKDINDLTGNAALPWVGTTFGDVYQSVMSFGDSALASVIPGGHILLGMNAATSEMKNLYERGASSGQIFAGGLLAGAAEMAFEKISIGELKKLKNMDKKAVKTFWQKVVRGTIMGGVEASEEMATEIANAITDGLVMGSRSDWEDFGTFAKNVVNAGIGGFLSGGLGGYIAASANQSQYNSKMRERGQDLIDEGSVDTLQNLALEMVSNNDTKYSKQLSRLSNKVSKNASAKNVGILSDIMGDAINTQNATEITAALMEKGLNKKDAKRVSEYLTSTKDLTREQLKEVESNKKIKAVAEELLDNPDSNINERTKKLLAARLGVQYSSGKIADTATTNSEMPLNAEVDVKNKISSNKKTTQVSSGETVTINKNNAIAKTKNIDGERIVYFNTDKGVVSSKDITYASEDEALMYESFVDLNPAFANAVIKNYEGNVPVDTYIKGMREGIILYGMHNFQGVGKDISKNSFLADLSEIDQNFALKLGRAYAEHTAKKQDNALKTAIKNAAVKSQSEETISNNTKKGIVHYENGAKPKNKLQKKTVTLAKHLARAIGIDIVFYDSTKGGIGSDDNGYFNEDTDTIYLDLQHSASDAKTIAYTLSHELVHFIQKWSAKKYNTFSKFLMEQYAEHGIDTSKLLANKMAELDTEDADYAYSEMIADACETMLLDSNAVYKLMELRKTDLELFEKIKLHIHDLLNKIRAEYKKLGFQPTSDEAKAVLSMKDSLEQIYSMFEEASVDAAKNYQAASKVGIDKQSKDIKKQAKKSFADYNKPITKEDIKTLRSIGRKSVNKFKPADLEKAQKWAYKFYQQLGVKSPFFRAWFGDWRAYDSNKIKYKSNIQLLSLESAEQTKEYFNKGLKDKTLYRGDVRNLDTGYIINVGVQIYNDTITYANREFLRSKNVDNYQARLSILNNIKNIVENSTLLDTEIAFKDNSKSQNMYQSFFHKFYTLAKIQGEYYLVKLTVDELNSEGTIRRAYNVNDIKISPVAVSQVYEPADTTDDNGDLLSTISISNLHEIVKQYDKSFAPKHVDKHLVNEDGTPKKFYHGTNEKFTEFNPDEIALREGSFFFAENREDAKAYGDNVFEVYLTGDKFADYDNQPSEFYQLRDKRKQVEYLKERGYDGWYSDMDSGGWGKVSVFSNTQIKSATSNIGTFDKTEGDIRFQKKQVSNRTILSNALESAIDTSTQAGQNELKWLKAYQEKIATIEKEEEHLAELNAQIKEASFSKGSDRSKLADLKREKVKSNNRLNIYDKQLLRLEAMKPIRDILARETELVRKRTEEQGKIALAEAGEKWAKRELDLIRHGRDAKKNAVERTRETRDKRDAREVLQKLVLETSKWISYPSKTDVKCPDILRTPYAKFLKSIDLSSKRLLKGGDPTKNDIRLDSAMNSLALAIEKKLGTQDPNQETNNVLDTGYLDLPVHFVEKLREMADSVMGLMVAEDDHVVNHMTSVEIKQLTQLIRTLNHSIKEMSTLYSNARFANIEDLGDNSMSFMDSMGEIEKTNAVADFVGWDNALPYYAFKRFGLGGESVFEGLMDAQDKLAFLADKIFKFRDANWTDKEARSWSNDTHKIELTSGNTLTLTSSQAMSIYCLYRREQGKQHLLGGGVRVLGVEKNGKKSKDSRSNLTLEDISAIVSSLTEQQKKVAESIQKFMSTVCSDWGNEISMKRFLTKEFTEKFYFPIESNDENLDTKDPKAQQSDLYRLLNISATKPLTQGANNEVIIRNIFDVFTNHTSDMARLNAYGMALLDYMKWINYREKTVSKDGQVTVRGVRKSMERTYGDKAKGYVINLIKDINGRANDGGDHAWLMKMTRAAKTAAVGNSLRVAVLQFTAYPRAVLVLKQKNLILGLTKRPQIRKAQKYCGIALWKSFGFYDTNIARSIEDQIKGATDVKQKLIELSLKGAEWGDAITWGMLWNACEYEVAQTKQYKVGSEEFNQAVGKKLREVVYSTQVVDSMLTRSQIMRNKSGLTQSATAFMSEPTVSANILMNAAFEFNKEKRTSGSVKTAWKKTSKLIGKTVAIYSIGQIAAAVTEALIDAYRDDEDERFLEKFKNAFVENSITDLNPLSKFPILADVIEAAQSLLGIGFFSNDRLDTTWLGQAVSAVETWKEVLSGKETSKTYYNAIYNTARALSSISGVAGAGLMREVVVLWNNTAGTYDSTLKIKSYKPTKAELGQNLYEAIVEGDTRQSESIEAKFEDEAAVDNALIKAIRENDQKVIETASKYINGDLASYKAMVDELITQGFDSDVAADSVRKVIGKVKSAAQAEADGDTETYEKKVEELLELGYDENQLMEDIEFIEAEPSDDTEKVKSRWKKEDYVTAVTNGDTDMAAIIKADLIETDIQNGKTEEEAEKSLSNALNNGYKEQFFNGEISESEAEAWIRERYPENTDSDVYWELKKWKKQKEHLGEADYSYSKFGEYYDAILSGDKRAINSFKLEMQRYNNYDSKVNTQVAGDIQISITNHFKPIYQKASPSERASLKPKLLYAYMSLGYTYDRISKKIDKWLQED